MYGERFDYNFPKSAVQYQIVWKYSNQFSQNWICSNMSCILFKLYIYAMKVNIKTPVDVSKQKNTYMALYGE